MADDLIIASTTDTPAQIEEAMAHGATPNAEAVLSTEEPENKVEEKPAEKVPEKKVETAKVEEKKPEQKVEKKADEEKPEEHRRFQKRIDALVAEREAERRRADELQAKLEAAGKPGEKQPDEAAAPVVSDSPDAAWLAKNPEPKEDGYATYDEYQKAWVRWNNKFEREQDRLVAENAATKAAEKVIASREEAAQKAADEETVTELFQTFERTKEDARAFYDDFDDVMANAKDLPLTAPMQRLIVTAEEGFGHHIAYYLAQNPEEARRIASMKDLGDVERALGRLEIQVEQKVANIKRGRQAAETADERRTREAAEAAAAETKPAEKEEKKPEKKVVTKAPEPISPVGARGVTTTKDLSDPNMDQVDWKAERNRQEQARRRR